MSTTAAPTESETFPLTESTGTDAAAEVVRLIVGSDTVTVHADDVASASFADLPATFPRDRLEAYTQTLRNAGCVVILEADPMSASAAPAKKNGKPAPAKKGAGVILKEVKAEAEANGTAKPAAPKKPAKPAAKTPAGKTEDIGEKSKGGRPAKSKLPAVVKVPTGDVKEMDLTDLTFDRRLQMRHSFLDSETVTKYSELYRDNPAALPPVRVVELTKEEAEEAGVETRWVVWDGFQRGEAKRQSGGKSIKVEIVKGTWELAERLALQANSEHGLTRTSADIRKAFNRFFADHELVTKACEMAANGDGLNRTIARVLNVSKGTVSNIMKGLGLTIRGNKIVRKAITAPAGTDGPTDRFAGRTDPPAAGLRIESKEAIKSRLTAALIREMTHAAAQIQRRTEELLTRPDAVNLFRELAQRHGIPTKRDETPVERRPDGEAKDADAPAKHAVEVTEYWPGIDQVCLVLNELEVQHGKMNTSSTA